MVCIKQKKIATSLLSDKTV